MHGRNVGFRLFSWFMDMNRWRAGSGWRGVWIEPLYPTYELSYRSARISPLHYYLNLGPLIPHSIKAIMMQIHFVF